METDAVQNVTQIGFCSRNRQNCCSESKNRDSDSDIGVERDRDIAMDKDMDTP